MITIDEQQIAAGKAVARSYIKQRGVQDADAKHSIERFLSSYEAVREVTGSHDAALYVAAQEGRRVLRAQPRNGRYRYPDSPGSLLKDLEHTPEVLAGYFTYLHGAAEQKSDNTRVSALVLESRTYVLQKPIVADALVGLEQEQRDLEKYARQLFLYDPHTMSNQDTGRFPKTILLVGPPGTGKSSLIKYLFATAKHLERITGLRCTTEIYDASSFSSYFGKSTRILKQKLERAANPAGVGLFCIEDVDMVLQSRNEHAFHGVMELQQHLMNHLSGLTPYYGNTLTLLSTNRPESIDEALRSRIQATYIVNPFRHVAVHEQFLRLHLPQLGEKKELAALTRAAEFTGRDLERVVLQARAVTTRAPTDEELVARNGKRYGTIDAALLKAIIAAGTTVQHTQA